MKPQKMCILSHDKIIELFETIVFFFIENAKSPFFYPRLLGANKNVHKQEKKHLERRPTGTPSIYSL